MSQPPLNALRAFEAVARLNSFSAAAGALFVTQSAVSHQIRHLEDWLGAPLFDRSTGRPRLLPRGAELARRLSLSFAEIDAACAEARRTGQTSALVIAAIPSVAVCWLIPRLEGFRAAHPDIPLRVIYAFHGHEIDFSATQFAFVFAARPPSLPGVRAHRFLPGISAPVCSPSLLPGFANRHPGPDEISGAGLLHDTDTTAWRDWLTRAKGRAEEAFAGPVFEDFNLLRAAALAGQGVALCPLSMIRDDLDQGRLVQLSDVTVLESHAYYLLTPETIPDDQAEAVQAFATWVRVHGDPDEGSVIPAPSAPGSVR